MLVRDRMSKDVVLITSTTTILEAEKLMKENEIRRLPVVDRDKFCLLYTSPSPRDRTRSRMPSSA